MNEIENTIVRPHAPLISKNKIQINRFVKRLKYFSYFILFVLLIITVTVFSILGERNSITSPGFAGTPSVY